MSIESRSGRWRYAMIVAPLLLLSGLGTAGAQDLTTTTTDYTYNADGALTAVTTQVDDKAPETTYLTWDNFVPDAADPTTGTTAMGDGNLLSYGPAPGSGGQEAEFSFDRRDRLVGYANAQHSIAYDHHATGLMASAALDGAEAWHFYYDESQNPRVTNIYEPSTQRWSGYLGAARFISDGEEQVLIEPRNNLACVYHPAQQSVEAHNYDAYGGQANATPAPGYDLSENPFQYAGEFRDPLWGGIYLRARWYDPDFPIFLSRDPMSEQLNHYGYAGGNPVMNTDPSGQRYRLGRGVKRFTSGVGGHFTRLLFSPFLAPLQLAAHPKAFWKQLRPKNPTFWLTLAGVAAEFAGPIGDFVAPVWVNSLSLRTRFTARLATDAVLGFGQSATQAGLTKGFKHFDWNSFGQGVEYTVGGIGWTRGLAGIGYRPFGIKSSKLEDFVTAKARSLDNDEALVFRERRPVRFSDKPDEDEPVDEDAPAKKGRKANWTTPLQESRNLGLYHERIVAITKSGWVYTTEMLADGLRAEQFRNVRSFVQSIENGEFKSSKFQFVGRKAAFERNLIRRANPLGFATQKEVARYGDDPLPEHYRQYSSIYANCQDHAAAVLEELGVR